MGGKARWFILVGSVLLAASVTLQGCAAGSHRPAGLDQKIVNAQSRGDHEELALIYERQAEADRASVKEHEARAQAYRRSPGYRGFGASMARHCETVAREYRQAAEENAALAKIHREMAANANH